MSSSENSLYTWLKENGLWLFAGDTSGRVITHVFLDGGKAHVPIDQANEFHKRYAQCIRDGTPQYVVEQRTPLFRLFMDIDLRSRFATPSDSIERIMACIYACSKEFFSPLTSPMIACTVPDRQLADGTHKVGVHLHWPGVMVTSSKALSFRVMCINKCIDSFGECYASTWSQIIDAAVYKSSGLRMIGSFKRDAPGAYYPHMVFRSDGSVQSLVHSSILANLETWLADASIRVSSKIDSPPTDSTDARHEELLLKSEHRGNLNRMSLADASVRRIATALEASLPPFFRHCKVTSIYKIVPTGSKNVANNKFIFGTNCKNCMNKVSGSHRSNHVYFLVNSNGVHQRCFCRCDTSEGRRYGECREFSEKVCNLGALSELLYGKPSPASLLKGQQNPVAALSQAVLRAYQ